MRGDIVSFSQTLNYALLHATKQGSEAHSIIRRVMRQSNGFKSWRQLQLQFAGGHRAQHLSLLRAIMQPSLTNETRLSRQFTRQYYKWQEDINRYEAENGHGSITDHAKIATVVNNLKSNIAENLMMRINQTTTFDDVHQWISNYFNSTYAGTEEDNRGQVGGVSSYDKENYDNEEYNEEENDESWDYDNNDPVTIAFMKVRARGQKKGNLKKGDNNKSKEGRTATCYTCRKQGHTSTFCYKGQQQSSYYYSQQPGKGYPQSPPYHQQYYSQPSTPQYPPSTSQPSKGYSKGNKGGKKGQQVPVRQINDNEYYYFEEDPYAWDNSWSQEWYPEGDSNPQWSGQEVGRVLQQQPSGDTTTSPQTMGSLSDSSLKAVGYNGYNGYNGSNDIHLDRQSPRHLKDFWSIFFDT
eukprot:3046617-Amphidinium_carterae.1